MILIKSVCIKFAHEIIKKLPILVFKNFSINENKFILFLTEFLEKELKINLDIERINERIKKEVCYNTISKLSDTSLMKKYSKCSSVKNKISNFKNILLDENLDLKIINNILLKYLLQLIPPGTKGVIRGIEFNNIIKKFIKNLKLDKDRFKVCFEEKCDKYIFEIPDWYIIDKTTNKIIIGMNQLDLWGGGHQINRGSNYLENKNDENCKLLCVVCNEIEFKNKNKAFHFFEIGFKNNTICYLKNLQNIINTFFNI